MRISDWSSDVCSSDLLSCQNHPVNGFRIQYFLGKPAVSPIGRVASFSIGFTLILPIFPSGRARRQDALLEIPVHADSETTDTEHRQENGRASCRERECWNVYIRVVAVPLQKKNPRRTNYS